MNKFQQPGRVKTINSSILNPNDGGLKMVLSVANMAGKPEGNLLLSVFDRKWKQVRAEAKGAFANKTGAYKLGALLNPVAVNSDIWVMPLLCMDASLKVDVKALESCLKAVCASAKYEKSSVHVSTVLTVAIPELADLLNKHLVEEGVSVSFYQEPTV